MLEFEKISSFADGELPLIDHDTVITQLASNRCARGAWARYHIIGDILRECSVANPAGAFADAVRRLVRAEPTVLASSAQQRQIRPLAGWAIAATVALMAVIAAHNYRVDPDAAVQPLVAAGPLPPTAAPSVPDNRAETVAAGQHDHRGRAEHYSRRLNSYLVNFNEQRSSLGVPGVPPYVRIVGYEAR